MNPWVFLTWRAFLKANELIDSLDKRTDVQKKADRAKEKLERRQHVRRQWAAVGRGFMWLFKKTWKSTVGKVLLAVLLFRLISWVWGG
jgi:hypothetical protein